MSWSLHLNGTVKEVLFSIEQADPVQCAHITNNLDGHISTFLSAMQALSEEIEHAEQEGATSVIVNASGHTDNINRYFTICVSAIDLPTIQDVTNREDF